MRARHGLSGALQKGINGVFLAPRFGDFPGVFFAVADRPQNSLARDGL